MGMIGRVAGVCLIASPFVAIAVVGSEMYGWLAVVTAYLQTAAIVTVVSVGVYLVNK